MTRSPLSTSSGGPPLWLLLGSIIAALSAGTVIASLATGPLLGAVSSPVLGGGGSGLGDSFVPAFALVLVESALAAGVLRQILHFVGDWEVPLGSAFVALAAGSGAAFLATWPLATMTRGPTSVPDVGGMTAMPITIFLEVGIAYLLLRPAVRSRRRNVELPHTWFEPAATPSVLDREQEIAACRTAVDSICRDIGASPPLDVPRRVLLALADLEPRADRVAELPLRVDEARPAQARLVRGLRQFAEDLTVLSRRPDGARDSIENSPGLHEIRRAFGELRALGLAA